MKTMTLCWDFFHFSDLWLSISLCNISENRAIPCAWGLILFLAWADPRAKYSKIKFHFFLSGCMLSSALWSICINDLQIALSKSYVWTLQWNFLSRLDYKNKQSKKGSYQVSKNLLVSFMITGNSPVCWISKAVVSQSGEKEQMMENDTQFLRTEEAGP